MAMCIFCKSTTESFKTREHILPESLGGGDWAILPDDLFCDRCQNKFGSTIEQQALANYPFSFLRVFLGIPTKKGKAPWFESWQGVISASSKSGQIGYEPSSIFKQAFDEGRKTHMTIPAYPLKPDMVCRTLLKMGIEVVAAHDSTDVFDEKFDSARKYALSGQKQGDWWYLQREDMSSVSRYITQGVTQQDWHENIKLEVSSIEDGGEVFHLKLLYLDLITPLEPRIKPPLMNDLNEPEYRLFVV
jgi:hypothetical protein